MNLDEMLEEIEERIRRIKKTDKVFIVHHDDADGCCSATLLSILIHNLIQEYPMLFHLKGADDIKKLTKELSSLSPDHIFILDLPVDIKDVKSFNGFILDHHIFSTSEKSEHIPYFNPRSFEKEDEKIVPTSCMVYKLLVKMFPDEKVAWIAGIGITEDHRVEICRDIFEKIKKETPELLNEVQINQQNIEKSVFGQLWDMVKSGRMIKKMEGPKTAVLALIECKDRPDKFINGLTQHSFALRKFYEKMIYETQNWLNEVKNKGRFYSGKKVIFYTTKSSRIMGMSSFLADKIRQEFPEWIVCVVHQDIRRKTAKISIRLEQTKRSEDLIFVLEKIKETIPSLKGGGHKSAVGIKLDLKDIKKFERQFIDSI